MRTRAYSSIILVLVLAACDADSRSPAMTTPFGDASVDAPDMGAGPGGDLGPTDLCGDGLLSDDELCDDGNVQAGDGCDAECALEAGYECPVAGRPCVALPRCGDGTVDASEGEVCDDGNEASGDGCTADCGEIEAYHTCPAVGGPCATVPFDEVLSAGLDQYVGMDPPSSSIDVGGQTMHTWFGSDGPRCLSGSPFRTATRDVGSEDLVIFFPGGGICAPEVPICMPASIFGRVGGNGVLDHTNDNNPFAGWNASQIAYCDGSILAGDTPLFRGLQNLTAGLDVTKATFPNPRRILLAGSSGGAYGTLPAVPLVRATYPDAEILVVNDAGFGLGRPNDPGFIRRIGEAQGFDHLFDAACASASSYTDCESSPHATWMLDYAMREDDNLRVATISSYGDMVIGGVFLQQYNLVEFAAAALNPWPVGPQVADVTRPFADMLTSEVRRLSELYPGRFGGFLYEGFGHVLIGQGVEYPGELAWLVDPLQSIFLQQPTYYGAELEGVRLTEWLDRALNRPDEFRTLEQR